MGLWDYGDYGTMRTMGLWDYGDYGTMGLWDYGTMGLWDYGTMGSRREFVKLISARSKTKSQVYGLQNCF